MTSSLGAEPHLLFLRGLSREALQDFRGITRTAQHRSGFVLFAEGEAARGLFVLQAGKVKLSASSHKGRTLTFRIACPGDVLGLSATVAGGPYGAEAKAVGPCQLDFVERADFLGFLERHPAACFEVVQILSQEVTGMQEQVGFFGGPLSASGRLALLLLAWCAESGVKTGQGIRLNIGLTAKDMGQLVGASRETVARLLSKLKDGGIIARNGRVFLIRDKSALEALTRPQAEGEQSLDQHSAVEAQALI